MFFAFRRFALMFAVVSVLQLSPNAFAFGRGDQWKPISPAELQQKEPKVEKDADAEAIFWEVRVDDGSAEELALNHYVRVKIYTERGREKFSKVDIPFVKGKKIRDIAARIIKPDGSTVELKKEDVLERDIVKADGVKIKAKSFAVPEINPGVIVEYRYREVIPNGIANNMRLVFQRDIPMQNVTYYVRPAGLGGVLKYLRFNLGDTQFEKDKNGFFRATLTDVPALQTEPNMPPEDEVRSWMLIYYTSKEGANPATYWANAGGVIVEVFDIKDTLKPNGELKKAVAEIVGNAATSDEKVTKLFEFCRTEIKNVTYDTALTAEVREKIKPNKSTNDTYKRRQGTLGDINELFASLAVAAGYEARVAFAGNRNEIFFSPRYAHVSFINPAGIAVKVDERWKFYAPGDQFAAPSGLAWNYENSNVFLLGYKDYVTTQTPIAEPDKSIEKRTAKLKLLEDGTLEGTVNVEYSGHSGYQRKINSYEESPIKREESFKEEVKGRISTAELSDVQIQNVADGDKPFTYAYKVRVPNYAQKTGKRLFLQPNFFEYNAAPQFTAANRKHDITFNYPWSEVDEIEIELPAGFALDNADAPTAISDGNRIGFHEVKMSITADKKTLRYKRNFFFGRGGNIVFGANAYPAIKQMFDAFHKADTHTITLKQQ